MGDNEKDRRSEYHLSGAYAAARDTIVALSTAPGRAAIGIVRLTGPSAAAVAGRIAGSLPAPRRAALRVLRDAAGTILDHGVVIFYAAPHSYTGEDLVELQAHGSPVVVDLLIAAALEAGARLAAPGEFTQRAFLNQRLDLAQAEAVADLIEAASEAAARAAVRALGGELSRASRALAAAILDLRARVEVAIDFDGEDLPQPDREAQRAILDQLRARLAVLRANAAQGALLGEGVHAVLCGAPNVGKSSLLNRLCGDERAIVTPVPGTTRDVLREPLDLDGLPLRLSDTAGLRDPGDAVEREGVRRARAEIDNADLVLHVVEDGAPRPPPPPLRAGVACITVRNKIDLSGAAPGLSETAEGLNVSASALTGAGLDRLREAIRRATGYHPGDGATVLARRRHLDALDRAAEALAAAAGVLDSPELFAEDLRCAQRSLGEISGAVATDDLLDRIFSTFCIGK